MKSVSQNDIKKVSWDSSSSMPRYLNNYPKIRYSLKRHFTGKGSTVLAVLLQNDWLLSVKTGLCRLNWWLSWNLYLCLVLSVANQCTWLFQYSDGDFAYLNQLLCQLLPIYEWLSFVLLQSLQSHQD